MSINANTASVKPALETEVDIDQYVAHVDAATKQLEDCRQMADALEATIRRLTLAVDKFIPHDGLCDRCDDFKGDCLLVDRANPLPYRTHDTICLACRQA